MNLPIFEGVAILDTAQIHLWQDDFEFLVAQLRSQHANLYHTVSQAQFDEAVDALRTQIPALERHEIIMGMARIVALVGDGHTSFWLDENGSLDFHRYPLRFYEFSDGIVVRVTDAAHQNYLGAKLIKIGSSSTNEVIAKVREVVSGDNDVMRAQKACGCLNIPEVLHALKIIPALDAGELTLELASGEMVTLRPSLHKQHDITWIDLSANETPLALWRQHPERHYGYEYLEAEKTIYVNFRVVRNADDESIAAFSERLFTFIDSHRVERFVLDVRSNVGGNNTLNQPLVHGLICAKKINQRGKLFTIVGRHTFSAAMNLVIDLERNTQTLFVGEPTGASPNHYGETFNVILPHSGIGLTISIWYWQSSFPNDKRPHVEPQIPVAMSSRDYRDNIDPALETIRAYTHDPAQDSPYPAYLVYLNRR